MSVRVLWLGVAQAHVMDGPHQTACGRQMPRRVTEAPSWHPVCRKCADLAGLVLADQGELLRLANRATRLHRELQLALASLEE